MIARTGLSVREHQERTVANYLELRSITPGLPFIPVIQGWSLDDHLRCVELYRQAGIDLASMPRCGLGSVCRRQSTTEIATITAVLASGGLRLHGFGVKDGRAGPIRPPANVGRLDGLELRRAQVTAAGWLHGP